MKPKVIPKHSVFGNYNLITLGPVKFGDGETKYEVMCTCGKVYFIRRSRLLTNKYGCIICSSGKGNKVHGQSNKSISPEYRSWNHLKNRCLNKNNKAYKKYGGRGIKVCDRWLESFENFYADMGLKPSSKHSIDRINNDGDYSPENCRWATNKEQSRNRRTNTYMEHNGEVKTLVEWSECLGINKGTISTRITQKKWSVEKSLTTPTKEKYRRKK